MREQLKCLQAAGLCIAFLVLSQAAAASTSCDGLLSAPDSSLPSEADLRSCSAVIMGQPETDRTATLKGMLAENGIGVKRSKRSARLYYESAAEGGYGPAQFLLAQLMISRLGVDQDDYDVAGGLLVSSGENGVSDAIVLLNELIAQGKISAEMAASNTQMLAEEAKAGNTAAQVQVALQLLQENGASAQAANWLREAATSGNAEAQFYLGQLIRAHPDLRRSDENSIDLLSAAARAGHAGALTEIGALRVREKNYAEGLKLLNHSARLHNSQALRLLGQMYFDGTGVTRNTRKGADFWFQAAQMGDDASRLKLLYNFDRLDREDQLIFNASFRSEHTYTTDLGLLLFANYNMSVVNRGLAGEYIKGELGRYHDAMGAYTILARSEDPNYSEKAAQISSRMRAEYDGYKAGLKDRRRQREISIWVGLGVGVLALLSMGGNGEYNKNAGVTFDPCAGINGIGYYGLRYANMAAIAGCNPY